METLKKFDKAKAEVKKQIDLCNQIEVKTDQDCEVARGTLKQAIETKSLIEYKRKELVQPHLEAQRSINDYAKELSLPLEAAIATGKKKVLEYEQEKERKRLEELAALEKIRREREAAERAERERAEYYKAKLRKLDEDAIKGMHRCETVKQIDDFIQALRMYSTSEKQFAEFASDAAELKKALLERAAMHRDFLKKQEMQKAETERLKGIEREQAELRAAQEAEANKIREEIEAIEREKARMEKEKREREEMEAEEIRKAIEAKEEEGRIKELEKQKAKNIRKDWAFEVINHNQVPREFLTVDEAKVKTAIKNGVRSITGIAIYQKDVAVIR